MESVHDWHVAVHEYELVICPIPLTGAGAFLLEGLPPLDQECSLLAVECLVYTQLKSLLDYALERHDVENIVINNQDVFEIEATASVEA